MNPEGVERNSQRYDQLQLQKTGISNSLDSTEHDALWADDDKEAAANDDEEAAASDASEENDNSSSCK